MNPHAVLHATHTCNRAWHRATQVAKVGRGGPRAHTHTHARKQRYHMHHHARAGAVNAVRRG
eukprot:6969886-Alexandrium_andersonii.AAC.1